MNESLAIRLAVSLGIGLLVGAERERRKGGGPSRGTAGLRTFALVALTGGVSLAFGGEAVLVAAALIVGALATVGYSRSRGGDPGLTTEIALVATLLLGALAVREPALAAGLATVTVILLASRTRLHRFVRQVLTEQELHDALLFAAAALVILPLAPDRAVGPFGVLNPRILWRLVIIVMAASTLGYVALRALGSRLGLPLAGFASGFVSSAATIGSLGARAARHPDLARPAVSGAALSTVATFVQMAALLAATSRPALERLALPLLFGGAAAALYGAAFALRAARARSVDSVAGGRAFDLKGAVLFAATVTAVMFLAAALDQKYGERGLAVAAGLAGFADTHSAAISVASLVAAGRLDAGHGVLPILVGLTTNSVTKIVVAAVAGGRRFALQVVPGLLLVVAALWAGALVAR